MKYEAKQKHLLPTLITNWKKLCNNNLNQKINNI